jgi:antitoxin CcdA
MTYAQRLAHPAKRRPVNVSLSHDLVEQAKLSGINISAVAEAALATAVQDAKLAEWARNNAAGIAAINRFIEEEGLPLADLALF